MPVANYPWNNTDIEQSTIEIVAAISGSSSGGQYPLAAGVTCEALSDADYTVLLGMINAYLAINTGRLFTVQTVYDTIQALYVAFIYTFPA